MANSCSVWTPRARHTASDSCCSALAVELGLGGLAPRPVPVPDLDLVAFALRVARRARAKSCIRAALSASSEITPEMPCTYPGGWNILEDETRPMDEGPEDRDMIATVTIL